MLLPFLKMHGAANDFVVVDHRLPFLDEPLSGLVARLCDRRRGVGADGVLLLDSDPELDFTMRYFNSDGGAADYCGNGARCLARLALDLGLGRGGEVRFRTAVGVQSARRNGDRIEVRFGRVAAPERRERVAAAGREFSGWFVRPGVPHFVIETASLADVPLAEWGGSLRRSAVWGSEGANVDFCELRGPDRIGMRTFERGVEGETLACGSGALATALARAAAGAESPVRIETAGGDTLTVRWRRDGAEFEVWLEGPVEVAFSGQWTVNAATAAPTPQ
ncbi:MAG: diaminopimelate epimerase [Candidatus Eisenbacteria bacterium]